MEKSERQGPPREKTAGGLHETDWLSENLNVDAPAHSPKKLLVLGAFLGVRKTKKVNAMPGCQIPQLVERTNPLALVRRVWDTVREKKNLHSLRE